MPLFHYHDGAAIRTILLIFYNDGAAIRNIKQVYYNDGAAIRLVFTQGTVSPPPTLSESRVTTPDGATAQINLQSDGLLFYTQGANQTVQTLWHTPQDATAGSRYWVRFDVLSGNLTFGTAGTWHPLTSTVSWGTGQSGVGSSPLSTIAYIASDAGGSNIVASGQTNFSCIVDP